MTKTADITGFTLIEIMVTLAVAAIGLVALSAALDRSVDVAQKLESKTIANWVASNRMADLRMSRNFRTSGSDLAQQKMAGKEWRIVDNYYPTEDPNIVRVVVEVFDNENTELAVTASIGFLAKHKQAIIQ